MKHLTSEGFALGIFVSVATAFQATPNNAPAILRTKSMDISLRELARSNVKGAHGQLNRNRRLAMKPRIDDATNNDALEGKTSDWNWLFGLVLPLQLVYISNQWSRSSLYYLVDFSESADGFSAMNIDIGFTQSQYGLLASLAFTALFAVASLGAGMASDRLDRKQLTVFSAFGWGAATLGTSLSSSYNEVLTWRIAMGLACAFTTPAAYTLINERVPKDVRAFASSLYGTGVAFGGALASLSILLDATFGWRLALMIIGVSAFVAAGLAALTMSADSETSMLSPNFSEGNSVESIEGERDLISDLTQVTSTSRARWILSGSFLRFCSGLCIGVWSAPYFRMAFPDNAADYAVAQALITSAAGSASGLLGGAIADSLAAQADSESEATARKLWIPVVGSILAVPTFYMTMHVKSFEAAMAWLSFEYLVAECWFGPTISSLLSTVGGNVRGTGQGLFTMTGAIANLAPTVLGWYLANANSAGSSESSSALSELLSSAVCLGYISSAVCFAISTTETAAKEA